MVAPPGIVWLAKRAPYIIVPFLVTYVTTKPFIPPWASILMYLGILPLFLYIRGQYVAFREYRQAKEFGAVFPPLAVDVSYSLVGIIWRILFQKFQQGYVGDIPALMFSKYGNIFTFKLFVEHMILTTEPEYTKAILATQFDNFEKGPISYEEFFSLLGQGVFNSDGDIWKFHRSMTRPFFVKERIGHFDVFERHTEEVIRQVKARLREGYPVDFQDVIYRFTLDSATEFLFGQDVRSLSAGLAYPNFSRRVEHPADIFAHSFNTAQELTAFRGRRGQAWPLSEFWRDKVSEHRKTVEAFVDPIIEEALRKKNGTKVAGIKHEQIAEDDTLLDHLVRFTENQTIIRDEVLNIMIAGRDTTASTLTFMAYMLAEHPEVLKRLRQEILDVVGPSRRPTFEDIRQMRYLRAVINETLRLYPPVPFNVRTSRKPTTFPSKTPGKQPWFIPAGVKVIYSVFLMHRRKDLWGPDALEFDPDRFLDQRLHKYLTPNPFIFLPFNAGPRICLGQQFAYNEASYFMIRFLQSFSDIEFVSTSEPPPAEWAGIEGPQGRDRIWPTVHLTMSVRGNVWMTMKEANEDIPIEAKR